MGRTNIQSNARHIVTCCGSHLVPRTEQNTYRVLSGVVVQVLREQVHALYRKVIAVLQRRPALLISAAVGAATVTIDPARVPSFPIVSLEACLIMTRGMTSTSTRGKCVIYERLPVRCIYHMCREQQNTCFQEQSAKYPYF